MSLLVALQQIEADAFDLPAPRRHRGARIHPWLRYRLRDLGWAAVLAVEPDLQDELAGSGIGLRDSSDGLPADPLDSFDDRQLGPRWRADTTEPLSDLLRQAFAWDPGDPDRAVGLLDLAEDAYRQRQPFARELVGLARDELFACGLARDRQLAARAFALHATLAARICDPTAVQAVRMLERLRGPLDSLTLRTTLDLTASLSAQGYTDKTLDLLEARLNLLDRSRGVPRRDFFRAFIGVRMAGAAAEAFEPAEQHLERAGRIVERLLQQPLELDDDTPILDLYRARAEVAATRSLLARHATDATSRAEHGRALLAQGRSAFGFPPRLLHPTVGVLGHRPSQRWLFAEARIALAAGNTASFTRAQHRLAQVWASEPLYPYAARTFVRIMRQAATRLGTTPVQLVPPHPSTGWAADLTPPPNAVPDLRPARN